MNFDSDYPHPQQGQATTVVNLNHASYDIYIGRAGRGRDGTFGNPVERKKPCLQCGEEHRDNPSIVECYKKILALNLTDPEFRGQVRALAGNVLGCFCKPQACHGDVLAWVADHLRELELNGEEFNLYSKEFASYMGINPI